MPLPLETERLRLRAFAPDDASAVHGRLTSDPEVIRYTSRRSPSNSPEEAARSIERWMAHQDAHGFGPWAVIEKSTGELVGVCGIYYVEFKGPDVEVAYLIARDRWGRGYATESARAAVRFGFDERGLQRIVALILPVNVASVRVAEKLGMRREGPGRFYDLDVLVYGLER